LVIGLCVAHGLLPIPNLFFLFPSPFRSRFAQERQPKMTKSTQPANSEHSSEHPIVALFRHNVWANTVLFAVCAGLTTEQLQTSIVGAYGSVYETLWHIARSERSYLHRLTTGKPYAQPAGQPPPTVAELQESIRASGEGFIGFAPTVLGQDEVEIDWDGTPRMVPCSIILTQAINHATEHRAQIMTTLTQMGIEPPNIDAWSFFEATAL